MKKRSWIAYICILLMLIPCAALGASQTDEQAAPYTGIIGKRMKVYARGSEDAAVLGYVEPGTVVDVYEKLRTYTKIDFQGRIGYVLTKYTERVQRKNPFDGPMPGTSSYIGVARVKKNTSFKPEGYRYAIELKPGSHVAFKDVRDGRAYFEYRREEEDMSIPTSALELAFFSPWHSAQPGDLIYAFTTYYSVAKSEKNLGRMHNIDLAASLLTNVVIGQDEVFSFNGICGPYERETGYRLAPILSGESSVGYGGGTCQVCTTIYNIVLRIPTYIEEMHWHGQGGVQYVPAGFDATVGSRSDMRFRNILPYALRLEVEAGNGVMTAFVYRNEE